MIGQYNTNIGIQQKPGTYIIYPAEDSFHAKLEGSN